MQSVFAKVGLFVLVLVCLAVTARIGLAAFAAHNSRVAAAEAADAKFRPSDSVRQMLNRSAGNSPGMDGQHPCVFQSLSDNAAPQLGQCALPAVPGGPVDRFEADLRYGNFILRQSDLYLHDGFDVPLTRTYNSGDYLHPNRVHAFGRNANHPYDIAPLGSRFPYTYQIMVFEDGDFLDFPRTSPGTDFSDAIYQHTETSTAFHNAVEAWNGDGWTVWRADGSAIIFPEAYKATNTAQGAPIAMRDAAGDILDLHRDPLGNLQEIRTPHGHWIHFQYDDQSRITRAEDDQGHRVDYQYNGFGMLTDAAFSSGQARHYTYEGPLMTMIADEKGTILVRNSYQNRQLARQDFGNSRTYSYEYTPSANGSYAASVNVTQASGLQSQVSTESSVPNRIRTLAGH